MGRLVFLAGAILASMVGLAIAQDMKPPQIVPVAVDWDAAKSELIATPGRPPELGADEAIMRLNAAAARQFANIATSPVPVLLPFNAVAALRAAPEGTATFDFGSSDFRTAFFLAGPSGYDAGFIVTPASSGSFSKTSYTDDAIIMITGSSVLYELEGPTRDTGSAVKEFDGAYPGIRRQFLEHHLRYTFVRFSVPYIVS